MSWLGANVRCIGMVAFALFIGLGIGNFIATRSAVREATRAGLEYAAKREAAIGEAYAKFNIEFEEKMAKETARREVADAAAHKTYQDGIVQAARDRAALERFLANSRASLAKEKERSDGLSNVNTMLAEAARRVPDCTMGADIRRLLDATSGASSSGGGDNPAAAVAGTPASGASIPAEAGSPLTCDQLVRGYGALGEDRRILASQLNAILDWEETIRPPAPGP